MALLYALSVLCWWRVARKVGAAPGLALAALLLAYPSYVLLFHRLASDALYAAAFALAALLTARLVESRTSGRAAAVGLGSRAPRARSAGQPDPDRARTAAPAGSRRMAAAHRDARGVRRRRGGALAPVGGSQRRARRRLHRRSWCRPRPSALPRVRRRPHRRRPRTARRRESSRVQCKRISCRASRTARTASTSTRSSRRAARACTRTSSGSPTARGAGTTTTRTSHASGAKPSVRTPVSYARGVARDSWRLLWWPVFLPVGRERGRSRADSSRGSTQLPEPSEGQPIPSASVSGFISTPDGRFREVWTSPTEHEIFADDPADAAHLDRMNRRVDELLGRFSDRSANAELARGSTVPRAGFRGRPCGSSSRSSRLRSVGRAGLRLPLVLSAARRSW